MPIDRFFTPQELAPKATITIDGPEFQHMTKVVRSKLHDQVELVNGKGKLANAVISSIEKKKALLEIQNLEEVPPPDFRVVLAQAIPRINRLDTIIEKATELGVDDFYLFPGEKSERKALTDHQIERLKHITISAMKQCGRVYLPTLQMRPPLVKWDSLDYPSYYGDPDAEQWLISAWRSNPPGKGIIFFVGPESGFTQPETRHMNELGAKGICVHQNILRTDTAPLVALSVIHSLQRE